LLLEIADYRGDKLLDTCPAFDIGARHRRGMAVAPVIFSSVIVVLFSFRRLTGDLLVELPELDLELFERFPMDFILRIAFQVTAPPVVVLPEDVFRGAHQGKYSRTFYMRK
jgi:hypothetical protein